ncbi:MAG: UPF0262 family protein [Marinosulfonomonas sp.]|nr:UPF0262 family protein [Marinosulfonomonas sp.]
MTRLIEIDVDDSGRLDPTPEIEQERRVAIFDLLEDNSFTLLGRAADNDGPLKLRLAIRDQRLVFELRREDDELAAEFHLSRGPFRQVIKDYYMICASYFDAVKTMSPSQIETIDMARRGIHNEGARVLQERLAGKAEVDADTARRLFTLISVLRAGV